MSRHRAPTEKIADLFYDLSLIEQGAMLRTLNTIHRLCKRDRDRSWKRPTAAELFPDPSDPAQNAALLLDSPTEGPKQ